MLTSVYKDIPDDSIEGTKIKDNTDVDYFGDVRVRFLKVITSGGDVRAQLSTYSDGGELHLWTGSTKTFYLHADESQNSYINRYLLLKGTSTSVSTSTYPFQILSGGLWANDIVSSEQLYIRDTGGTHRIILNTFNDNGIATLFNSSGSIKYYLSAKDGTSSYISTKIILGGSSTSYSIVTYPVQVSGNFAVDGAVAIANDITANNLASNIGDISSAAISNALSNITSQNISTTEWGYVAGTDQVLSTVGSPSFVNVVTGSANLNTLQSNFDAHDAEANAHNLSYTYDSTFGGSVAAVSAGTFALSGTATDTDLYYKSYTSSDGMMFRCAFRATNASIGGAAHTLRIRLGSYVGGTFDLRWSGFVMVFHNGDASAIPCYGYGVSGNNADIYIRPISPITFPDDTDYKIIFNIVAPKTTTI